MDRFIKGRFRLNFEGYSNEKYDNLILAKWPSIDNFCASAKVEGEIYDTEDQKVYFEYRVVRHTIKECRAIRTLVKAKLKEVYGVSVEETFCAEGSRY